jgi:UDP-N-acetylmuramoylalanine--D-glutamate ligase
MHILADKSVLVVGLGVSGRAACRLLALRGAKVTAIDGANTPALQLEAAELESQGVRTQLGAETVPAGSFDLAVLSPGIPKRSRLMAGVGERGIPVIGEFELGYQQSSCLNIAITGTNGKTTTTELVERMLTLAQRKCLAAGNIGLPVCGIADQTKALDYLVLEASSYQLETIQFFRPAVAVLLNLTPDHLDRYESMDEYLRAKVRIFENQQVFDWAIVQSAALAQMSALGMTVPSKLITFSATDQKADLHLDRGLIISRLEDWPGPILDMAHCKLRGPHNAENLMAALAVGRVLRLPLDTMREALKGFSPRPNRCEWVAELDGVQYINDSKATNVDALWKALQSVPTGSEPGQPNVFLIAGGADKGFGYHEIGPLLAQRVKEAFLIGETREKIRASWGLFTPCTLKDSLLEAVSEAAKKAVSGDIILLSPACSSFDQFRNYQHRGEVFRQAVASLGRPTNGSEKRVSPIAGGVSAG